MTAAAGSSSASGSGIAHVVAVATTSMGKLGELAALVRRAEKALPVPVRLLTLLETAPDLVIVEDGATFAENAAKKARALADRTRMLALADDTGLEVDRLGGAPGLHSARYAGTDGRSASDEANRTKLLRVLREAGAWEEASAPAGAADRVVKVTARFRCALALVDPLGGNASEGGVLISAEGVCEGHIVPVARGERGFGYDSIFVPDAPEATGRTMAELGFDEKQAISHRAVAFAALLPALVRQLVARRLGIEEALRRSGAGVVAGGMRS